MLQARAVLDARRIALEVLVRVEKGGAFANRALDAALSEAGRLDPRDVALATELTYGTLRRQVELDHALGLFSHQPLESLDFETRHLLRLGAYQILHLRVPDRAAVHETVELAKEYRNGRSATFVNAVLRSLLREKASLALPSPHTDPAGHLSLLESFPRWFVEYLIDWRGYDWTAQALKAANEPASLTVRVNRLRRTRDEAAFVVEALAGVSVEPTRHSPMGLVVAGARRPGDLVRPSEGLWQAQDEAAQLVGFLCAPKPGWKVLDACAAPGGKSCHLAELMDDEGLVDACDIHKGKLTDLAEGASRLGLTSVRTHAADASLPLPFAPDGGWDLALVDAPCSGLGTVRRHPELKLRRTLSDIERLAALQARILDNVAPLVRPGGILVYSVCTFTKEEGTEQVERFLARHPDYRRAPLPDGIDWTPFLDERGDIETDPHRHGLDAFFAARLERRSP